MSRGLVLPICALLLSGILSSNSPSAPMLPPGARVLDPNTNFYSWPKPTISPDGHWIAYVSQGWIKVCRLDDARIISILEVPNSWTWPHLKAPPGVTPQTGSYSSFPRGLSRDDYNFLHSQITSTIYGFNWTRDSDGFVFVVQRYDLEKKSSKTDVYLASLQGKLSALVQGNWNEVGNLQRGPGIGVLTADRKYLVSQGAQGYHRPLIWDIAAGRPRATCFLYLAPSLRSSRWIALEKDTRQLVLLNEHLEVIERFDLFRGDRSYAFHLDWSPDERYIIWRNQIGFDHYSNWEGYWMDLSTGEKRGLSGRFMAEQIGFTGQGGEFFRCGQDGERGRWSGDQVTGAHMTLVTEGYVDHDLWRITVDASGRMPGMLTNLPGNPPVRPSPNGDLFAIALPRPAGERSGGFWHLIDRAGKKWRFPVPDTESYIAPFDLAGFAENGKSLVGFDSTRLFIFPTESVHQDVNVVD